MGNNLRNKKKIRPHLVDKFDTNVIDDKTVGDLKYNLNGDSTFNKRTAKGIIQSLPRLKYKNGKQKDFHRLLLQKEVVACQGSAGTGKTFIAVYTALELLLNNDTKIEKIILTKPAQQLATENLGFIKGGLDEKIAPIMESFDGVFEELIGIANYRSLIEKGIIQYKPMAFLRGQTMKNAVILFDEVQMSSLHACRTLLQRLGEDSRIYLLGDKAQTENRNRRNNPLTLLYSKFENIEDFGVFEFGVEDIVRNKLIIIFEKVFEEIENEQSPPSKKGLI